MKPRDINGNLNGMYPRTIESMSNVEKAKKEKTATAGGDFGSFAGSGAATTFNAGPAGNVSRVPGRRYYDPTLMASALYLPRDFKLKNRWRRWWYTHDHITGMVFDTHAEMAASTAETLCEDPSIGRTAEDMFDSMNLFTNMQNIDLEYMKIGEVTLYDLWSNEKGYFIKTVIHNPDFVEVSASQLAPDEPVVELRPSTDLRRLVMSTNPRDLQLKKRIPRDILARVATGRNIPLEPEFTTRIVRLANPYDVRGTSIIDRLFRILMYEDKISEAQITIADNFIFPLKIFKLGDAQNNWVPPEDHMTALQDLLLQQHFDPNFSIIFHYGLTYECFVDDTPVVLFDGTVKPIQDISVGDKVLDKDGIEQTVEKNWCEGAPEEIIEISLIQGGTKIECTPNHKFPVWVWPRKCACGCNGDVRVGRSFVDSSHMSKYRKGKGRDSLLKQTPHTQKNSAAIITYGIPHDYEPIQDLKAEDIRKHDFLLLSRKFEEITPDVPIEWAKLLGFYVAEGWASEEGHVNFSFSKEEFDTYALEVEEAFKSIGFSCTRKYYESVRSTHVDMYPSKNLERVKFIEWLVKNGGRYSHKKLLSLDVMKWPLEYKKELIRAMFKGDGSHTLHKRDNNCEASYTTVSKDLSEQVRKICIQLGYYSDISIDYCSKKNPNWKDVYSVYFGGSQARGMAELVYGAKSKFANKQFKKMTTTFLDADWIYVPVQYVKKKKNIELKKVHNLTVSGSHSYQVYGYSTYNSHGLEGKILRLDREFERIDKIKMMALGVSPNFISGESTYASANAALQVMLSRYQAKRMIFEKKWIYKLLKYTAEKNGWYKRSKRELNAGYRVAIPEHEKEHRLIIPQLVWRKKLTSRDDQAFLSFLSGIYKEGNGAISHSTMLSAAGFNLGDEIRRKKSDALLEQKEGWPLIGGGQKPKTAPSGGGGGGGGLPGGLGALGKGEETPMVGDIESEVPPPPTSEALFKGFREKISKLLSRKKGSVGSTTIPSPTLEEIKKALTEGYSELKKEANELIGYYPDLKDSFDEKLFVGVEPKKKENDLFAGVLINTSKDDQVDYFFNRINTYPFENSFLNHISLIHGKEIKQQFSDIISNLCSKITQDVRENSLKITDTSDLIASFRNIFSTNSNTHFSSVYHTGKMTAYNKTNYVVYKSFLRRQYNSQEILTSDGFVDTIVVEENLLLFDHIISSVLNSLCKNKELAQVDTMLLTDRLVLLIKIFLFHMYSVGLLKGYEEQGFNDVNLNYHNPDLFSPRVKDVNVNIPSLFALGESSFDTLYSGASLFDITPSYSGECNFPEGFNEKISFNSNNIEITDCPVILSNFITTCVSKHDGKIKGIHFVDDISKIPNLSEKIKDRFGNVDPQLRMALFQKEVHILSNSTVFKLADAIYVTDKGNSFKDAFIEVILENCPLKKPANIYNFKESDFKKFIDSNYFVVADSGHYKIGSTSIPDTAEFTPDIRALFKLAQDYNIMDNFLWDKAGNFITDFNSLLTKDYVAAVINRYHQNPEFLKAYYPTIGSYLT